jgi:hypothetical protein
MHRVAVFAPVVLVLLFLVSSAALAVDFAGIAFSVTLTPVVDRSSDSAPWRVDFTLSTDWRLDGRNSLRLSGSSDSNLTHPEIGLRWLTMPTDAVYVGGGCRFTWATDSGSDYGSAFSFFASAATEAAFGASTQGQAELRLDLASVSQGDQGWEIRALPSGLPSLRLEGIFSLSAQGGFAAAVLFQPVFVDVTSLTHPVGVVNDHLILLPSFSADLLYLP